MIIKLTDRMENLDKLYKLGVAPRKRVCAIPILKFFVPPKKHAPLLKLQRNPMFTFGKGETTRGVGDSVESLVSPFSAVPF